MMCLYPRINIFVNAILFTFLVISPYSGLNAMEETTTENWNQRKHQSISEIETTTVHYSQASGYGYTCTFDYGMCGWTQLDQDAIDWTRWAGSTPSRYTGPLSDHTGSGKFYLYIEASGKPINANAKIIGPSFYITPLNPYCFSLWYNMYGGAIGTLNVYVKHSNRYFQRIWSRRGNQGPAWTYADVTVNGLGYIQIAIEGFVGRDFTGDIAIDDTHLKSVACRGIPTTVERTSNYLFPTTSLDSITSTSKKPLSRWTTTGPETLMGYNCTFDQSTCGWHQSTADVFDWTRHAGETLSYRTGPLSDHTSNSSVGKYMYIEASAPRRPGDNAKLFGPFFINGMNGMYCFSFWYNMFGGLGVGTLNVLVRNEHYTFLKWTKTGNRGRHWDKAEVTIKASSNKMQIVIEGIRGSSYTGDIAIDDTSLRSGKCENTIRSTSKAPRRTQTLATTRKHDHKISEPSGLSSGIIVLIITSCIVFCVICFISIRKLGKISRNTDRNTGILRRRNMTDQPFTISASQMEIHAFHDRSRDTTLHNHVENTSTDTNRTENQYEPPDYETLHTANDDLETEPRRSNSTRHLIQPSITLLSAIDELRDTYTSPVRLNLTSPSESPDTNEDTPPPNYWSLQEAHFWQCNGQTDDCEPPPYPGNSE